MVVRVRFVVGTGRTLVCSPAWAASGRGGRSERACAEAAVRSVRDRGGRPGGEWCFRGLCGEGFGVGSGVG